jgi:hypothetical protein
MKAILQKTRLYFPSPRAQLVDLRFTLPEALSFLNQCMGVNLLPSQAEILESRPEEWIAGVQTAALSLQHTPDGDGGIRDFSGSQRFILDYLIVCIIVLIKGESYARQSSIVYFLYCQPRSTTGCMQFYWQLRPAHD